MSEKYTIQEEGRRAFLEIRKMAEQGAFPDMTLDEYINLKGRVESRMKVTVMTATGDDNILSDDEKTDLEYRKAQLKRLQDEVVDIEEMSSGISIVDLGLNEFRLDLVEFMKNNPDMDKTPFGLHAVATSSDVTPPGTIFVLRNRTENINIDNRLLNNGITADGNTFNRLIV